MSYNSLLVNEVTITRPSVAYTDGVSTKSYTVINTKIKCNIQWISSASSFDLQNKGFELTEGWVGFFKHAVNLRIDDKITDEKGRVFIVKTSPEDITGRKHHVECRLAEIS